MNNQRDAGPGSRSALARQREVGAGREACGRGLLRVLASGIFLGLLCLGWLTASVTLDPTAQRKQVGDRKVNL